MSTNQNFEFLDGSVRKKGEARDGPDRHWKGVVGPFQYATCISRFFFGPPDEYFVHRFITVEQDKVMKEVFKSMFEKAEGRSMIRPEELQIWWDELGYPSNLYKKAVVLTQYLGLISTSENRYRGKYVVFHG